MRDVPPNLLIQRAFWVVLSLWSLKRSRRLYWYHTISASTESIKRHSQSTYRIAHSIQSAKPELPAYVISFIHNIMLLLLAEILSLLAALDPESDMPMVLLAFFNIFSASSSFEDSVLADDELRKPSDDCLRLDFERSDFLDPSGSELSLSYAGGTSRGIEEYRLENLDAGFPSLAGFAAASSA